VAGPGNPLAGDDAFGPAVIERLRAAPPPDAELVSPHTDLLGITEDFARFDHVVVVDAVLGHGTPGEVRVLEEVEFRDWPADSPDAHWVSALASIRVFRSLHPSAATRFSLVALATDGVRIGRAIDPAAVARGAQAVREVLGALRGSERDDEREREHEQDRQKVRDASVPDERNQR